MGSTETYSLAKGGELCITSDHLGSFEESSSQRCEYYLKAHVRVGVSLSHAVAL